MSAEYKTLVTIKRVTDHDCGLYKIGEIDGLFQQHELIEHIDSHGSTELLEHLAYLTYQVIEARNEAARMNQMREAQEEVNDR